MHTALDGAFDRALGGASPCSVAPAEQRFELGDRCAILGRACRADLAQPVCGLFDFVYASGLARLLECVAEALFGERRAARAADEGEIAAWTSRERARKRRQ